MSKPQPTTSDLVATVIDAGADHRDPDAAPDIGPRHDELPGVGAGPMSLGDGLAKGGTYTFVVLLALNSLDELERAALAVLAPDIRDAFGVSNAVVVFIASAMAAFVALGALPLGWLADRRRRGPIVGWVGLVFAAGVALSGLAASAFMLFWARFGVGAAKSSTTTVHASLLADTYPIAVRGRLASTNVMFGAAAAAISPLVIGGLADVFGWRAPWLVLGVPVAVIAVLAFGIAEPPRGRWEKRAVLGKDFADHADAAPRHGGFARLARIQTIRTAAAGFAAIGFGLFTMPVLASLYMDSRFDATAFERGVIVSIGGFAAVVVLPFVGHRFDTLFRTDPAKPLRLVGLCVVPAAGLIPLQFAMPNLFWFGVVGAVQLLLVSAAFAMVQALVWSLAPYRLRGLTTGLMTVYVFGVGAVGGALTAAWLLTGSSVRTAVTVLVVPVYLAAAALLLRAARSVPADLSLIVAELRDEASEHERQAAHPETVPAVQLSHVDFAYGRVQVLFDVSFEVAVGETLALLGPNGAGKSTALELIAGLHTPDRGVVRFHGRPITFDPPEKRGAMGIELLPGGRGVFGSLTVRDNLVVGAYRYRGDPADVARRIDAVLELFPALGGRLAAPAGDLSGGQQQMLALARVMLHEPDVLVLDELSLGLAPAVIQDLLATIDGLRAAGQTMIVVEQSFNVALAIADRAVFLEKGHVRFDGPATELADRDDLAQAVFFGSR